MWKNGTARRNKVHCALYVILISTDITPDLEINRPTYPPPHTTTHTYTNTHTQLLQHTTGHPEHEQTSSLPHPFRLAQRKKQGSPSGRSNSPVAHNLSLTRPALRSRAEQGVCPSNASGSHPSRVPCQSRRPAAIAALPSVHLRSGSQ